MRENVTPRQEGIGVSRNVIKTTPSRVTALWLFGIFMMASVVFVGTWFGYFLFGGFNDLAYMFGFGVTAFVGSVVGWFTIVLQENAQNVQIKVIKEQ
jgi:zinc transporter ZupT